MHGAQHPALIVAAAAAAATTVSSHTVIDAHDVLAHRAGSPFCSPANMAFNVFQDSDQGTCFVLLAVSGLICMVAVSLRFVATRLAGRKLGLEDWFAFSAGAVFLVRVGVVLSALTIINGRKLNLGLDRAAYEAALKRILVADLSTMLDQSLAKFSICALYYRLFGVNRRYALWIYIHAAAQATVYIALVILQLLQCRPLNKFWQWWAPGECFPFSTVVVSVEPPNSIISFTLVILAMLMIRDLHLKTGAKWRLRFLFGLGTFAGIIGFIRCGISYNPDEEYVSEAVGLWAVIQSLACIVCCCAPAYKPLFPEAGLLSRLASKISSYNPRGGSRGSSKASGSASHTGQASSVEMGNLQQVPGQGWLRLDASSTKWLVTSDPEGCPHTGDGAYPIDSIHVHRSIDVASGTGQTTSASIELQGRSGI